MSFNKHPEVPYVTSVGGNKSHVLPNDTFDVMHEAEQSGGVVFRHRGRALRFGIPDNVDKRPKYDIILPASPPRKSRGLSQAGERQPPLPAAGVSAA